MAKNILVIDDDVLVRKSLARLLEQNDYRVETAGSATEALKKIEETDFDLIISDIKMPDTDGIETMQKINAKSKNTDKEQVPVIFITGYSDEASYDSAQKLMPSDFIYKPFDKEKFLESVNIVLR